MKIIEHFKLVKDPTLRAMLIDSCEEEAGKTDEPTLHDAIMAGFGWHINTHYHIPSHIEHHEFWVSLQKLAKDKGYSVECQDVLDRCYLKEEDAEVTEVPLPGVIEMIADDTIRHICSRNPNCHEHYKVKVQDPYYKMMESAIKMLNFSWQTHELIEADVNPEDFYCMLADNTKDILEHLGYWYAVKSELSKPVQETRTLREVISKIKCKDLYHIFVDMLEDKLDGALAVGMYEDYPETFNRFLLDVHWQRKHYLLERHKIETIDFLDWVLHNPKVINDPKGWNTAREALVDKVEEQEEEPMDLDPLDVLASPFESWARGHKMTEKPSAPKVERHIPEDPSANKKLLL